MPNWEYDPRTGQMKPKKRGLEFYRVGGGMKVEDESKGISFIIMRASDTIQYKSGIVMERGIKLFDYRDAQIIAERVKRFCAAGYLSRDSKYKDYRWFCVSTVDPVDESVVNEAGTNGGSDDWFDVGGHSGEGSTKTVKMKQDGKWGRALLHAAPSAIIAGAVCWPVALVRLLGAVHIRAEKRWEKSMLNTSNWVDFITTPAQGNHRMTQREFDKLSQAEKQKYLSEQLKINNRFWYAMLNNGDVIMVISPDKEGARDMAKTIVSELVKDGGFYDELEKKCEDKDNTTYRVHLDNGEIIWWAAKDKATAETEARNSRTKIQKFYNERAKLFLNDPEGRNRPKYKGRMIDAKKMPNTDFVEIWDNYKFKKPSADERDIEISERQVDNFEGKGGNTYKFMDIPNMVLCIKALTEKDAAKVVYKIKDESKLTEWIDRSNAMAERGADTIDPETGKSDTRDYFVKVGCGDKFVISISRSWVERNMKDEYAKWEKLASSADERKSSTPSKPDKDAVRKSVVHEFIKNYISAIEDDIVNASKSVIREYRRVCGTRDQRWNAPERIKPDEEGKAWEDPDGELKYVKGAKTVFPDSSKVKVYDASGDSQKNDIENVQIAA